MKTLARNQNNDLFLTGSKLAVSEGGEAMKDIINSIVLTHLGELQFNPNGGIDYFSTVFENPSYIDIWAAQVRTAILELEFVDSIEDFEYSFDRNDGNMLWSATIITTTGERLDLKQNSHRPKGVELKVEASLSDIVGVPDGMFEFSEKMAALAEAAGGVGELTESDSLMTVKNAINKSLLAPLGAEMNDPEHTVRFGLDGVRAGQTIHFSNCIVSATSEWFVDYGDGVMSMMNAADHSIPNHSYSKGGTYVISIGGGVEGLSSVGSVSDFPGEATALASSIGGENSVSLITNDGMRSCENLVSLSIGGATELKRLGACCFCGCERLSSITVQRGASVEEFGAGCFMGTAIRDLTWIPPSVRTIGKKCFAYCNALSSPRNALSNVTSVGDGVFFCSGITTLSEFSTGSNSIPPYAFSGCDGLTTTDEMSEDVTAIGRNSFAGCQGLREIILHSSITSIGDGAFSDCPSVESVSCWAVIPPVLGISAFGDDMSDTPVWVRMPYLQDYRSADGWKDLPGLVSYGEMTFTFRGLPAGYSYYPYSVSVESSSDWYVDFGDGTHLKMPQTSGTIASHVFKKGGDVTVTLSGRFTSIGRGLTIPLFGEYGSQSMPYMVSASISSDVPLARMVGPLFLNCTALTSIDIACETLETIGDRCFYGCSALADIRLPSSVRTIGASAFENDVALNDLSWIPASLESVGNGCFKHCEGIASLDGLPGGLTSLGTNCFENCTSLTSVTGLPSSLTSLPDYCFNECASLASLCDLPNQIASIGRYCFAYTAIDSVAGLGDRIARIPDGCFFGCTKMNSLVGIPSSVTSVGNSAFGNTGITSLEGLHDGISELGQGCFARCKNLLSVAGFPVALTRLPSETFKGCSSLLSVTEGAFEGIVSIGGECFSGCISLGSVDWLPSTLKSIENNAFAGCVGITGLDGLPSSLETIGDAAFAGCDSVKTLTIPMNVRSIGYGSFSLPNLERMTSLPSVPPLAKDDKFDDNSFFGVSRDIPFRIPLTSFEAYASSKPFSSFWNRTAVGIKVSVSVGESGLTIIGGTTKINVDGTCAVNFGDGDTTYLDVDDSGNCVLPSHTYSAPGDYQILIDGTVRSISAADDDSGNPSFATKRGVESCFVGIEFVGEPALEEIGDLAFLGSKCIDTTWFPKTLRRIGRGAFCGSVLLERLDLENVSIVSIGSTAFKDCAALAHITLTQEVPPVIAEDTFDDDVSDIFIGVPVNAIPTYSSSEYWDRFVYGQDMKIVLTVEDTSMRYHDDAVFSYSRWTIDYGDGTPEESYSKDVHRPADHLFATQGEEHRVTITGCVYKLCGRDSECFGKLGYLTGLDFSGTSCVKEIGDYFLYYNKYIEDLQWMPPTVEKIGYRSFGNCQKLMSLAGMPASVVEIGVEAFEECYKLEDVSPWWNRVKRFGDECFIACGITVIDNLNVSAEIGNRAFSQNSSLKAVLSWPTEDASTIPDGCFSLCRSLDSDGLSVFKGLEITVVGEDCFSQSGVDSLDFLPPSVVRIEQKAFFLTPLAQSAECNVDLPRLEYIGEFAFGVEYGDIDTNLVVRLSAVVPPIVEDDIFGKRDSTKIEVVVPPDSIGAYEESDGWGVYFFCKTSWFSIDVAWLNGHKLFGNSYVKVLSGEVAYAPGRSYEKGIVIRYSGKAYRCTETVGADDNKNWESVSSRFKEVSNRILIDYCNGFREFKTADAYGYIQLECVDTVEILRDIEKIVFRGEVEAFGVNGENGHTFLSAHHHDTMLDTGDYGHGISDAYDKTVEEVLRFGDDIPLKRIGSGSFDGCVNLDIDGRFPSTLESIESYAFRETAVQDVDIFGNIVEIGEGAFYGSQVQTVDIASNMLSYIRDNAFGECSQLHSVVINSRSLEVLSGFTNCPSLTCVYVYAPSLHRVDEYAFANICSECALALYTDSVPEIYDNSFDGVFKPTMHLTVNEDLYMDFANAEVWGEFLVMKRQPMRIGYIGEGPYELHGESGRLTFADGCGKYWAVSAGGEVSIYDKDVVTSLPSKTIPLWHDEIYIWGPITEISAAPGTQGPFVKVTSTKHPGQMNCTMMIPDDFGLYDASDWKVVLEYIGPNTFYGEHYELITCFMENPPALSFEALEGSTIDSISVPAEYADRYRNADGWKDLPIYPMG